MGRQKMAYRKRHLVAGRLRGCDAAGLDATLWISLPLHHGGILIVAGGIARPDPWHLGPWVVDDLDDTIARLTGASAEIVNPVEPSQTGRFCYLSHPDGTVVEYGEWTADLVERFVDLPHRAVLLSSPS